MISGKKSLIKVKKEQKSLKKVKKRFDQHSGVRSTQKLVEIHNTHHMTCKFYALNKSEFLVLANTKEIDNYKSTAPNQRNLFLSPLYF